MYGENEKKKLSFYLNIYMENHITHANPPFCRKKNLSF